MSACSAYQGDAQCGFTLLEALITIVIVSIGLLGLFGLQTVSLVNTQVSAARSEASIAADNIADRMRANREGAVRGDYDDIEHPAEDYDDTNPIKLCRDDTTCSTSEMAAFDAWEWDRAIGQQLPNGRGAIDCERTADAKCVGYRVTIQWDERDREAVRASGGADTAANSVVAQSFETVVNP